MFLSGFSSCFHKRSPLLEPPRRLFHRDRRASLGAPAETAAGLLIEAPRPPVFHLKRPKNRLKSHENALKAGGNAFFPSTIERFVCIDLPLRQEVGFFDTTKTGEISSRLTQDCEGPRKS